MNPLNFSEVLAFYKGKSVFITGHTGFKGSWLCHILKVAGARVTGFSLEPPTNPSLFEVAHVAEGMKSMIGDIRDLDALTEAMRQAQPEVVLHLAAQPIVLTGYEEPVYTYETNVMGTVNLLEAVRGTSSVRSVVNITTDKVYFNAEREGYGYVETDPLDGYDPYSNSKSCSELVTHSYAKSFLTSTGVAVSTARAGNVIGGGDFAPNRIVPDCVRAVEAGEPLVIRNPYSTRPYQHVLEPLFAYLALAKAQIEHPEIAGAYNVGPDDCDCVTTGELVGLFEKSWGEGFTWENAAQDKNAPHEASFLKLSSNKLKTTLDWLPQWHINDAVDAVVEWSQTYLANEDVKSIMDAQIVRYCENGSN